MISYTDKTFIVTGGASGLGEAAVRFIAAKGANVALLDRDTDKGEGIAKELGDNVMFVFFDAADEDTIKAAVEKTVERFGGLNAVINSAGLGWAATIISKAGVHPTESFDFVQKVNVYGTFNMCKYASLAMSKNTPDEHGQRGVLINVASVAGYEGQKGQVAYAASKGAVLSMTLPMARDLGRHGIRVMTIAPGIFGTPMMMAASQKVRDGLAASVVHPKRLGLPEEFAHLCCSIFENRYLNGETIRIDGGVRMGYMSKI